MKKATHSSLNPFYIPIGSKNSNETKHINLSRPIDKYRKEMLENASSKEQIVIEEVSLQDSKGRKRIEETEY